jgi:hypothetical protein
MCLRIAAGPVDGVRRELGARHAGARIGELSVQAVFALQETFPDRFPALGWVQAEQVQAGTKEWTGRWAAFQLGLCGLMRRGVGDVLFDLWAWIAPDAPEQRPAAYGEQFVVLMRELRAHNVMARIETELATGLSVEHGGPGLPELVARFEPTKDWARALAKELEFTFVRGPEGRMVPAYGNPEGVHFTCMWRLRWAFVGRHQGVEMNKPSAWFVRLGEHIERPQAAGNIPALLRVMKHVWGLSPYVIGLVEEVKRDEAAGENPTTGARLVGRIGRIFQGLGPPVVPLMIGLQRLERAVSAYMRGQGNIRRADVLSVLSDVHVVVYFEPGAYMRVSTVLERLQRRLDYDELAKPKKPLLRGIHRELEDVVKLLSWHRRDDGMPEEFAD